MAYSEKVVDHYNNPRNVGSFPKDTLGVGTGLVGAPECGDVCVDDEGRQVLTPRDDVDLLALQLLDDRLNAAALHADTGADRIDRAVVADDADLGAAAGVA